MMKTQVTEKLKKAKKWANIMDSLSKQWQHVKAKRAFDKLHSIYLRMIANGHDPKEYSI